jgi:hypothetical protein
MYIFSSKRDPGLENEFDDIFYDYSVDDGDTWLQGFRFTTDKWDDTWPSVVQTADSRILVVWTSDRYEQPDWGNYDLYMRSSLVGDVNEDGIVNVIDITLVSLAFGFFQGEPGYDPAADINVDGIVDMRDLALVAMNFGAS